MGWRWVVWAGCLCSNRASGGLMKCSARFVMPMYSTSHVTGDRCVVHAGLVYISGVTCVVHAWCVHGKAFGHGCSCCYCCYLVPSSLMESASLLCVLMESASLLCVLSSDTLPCYLPADTLPAVPFICRPFPCAPPWQAETITSALLELPKLRQYRQLQYTPSRNRQWHMFTGVERPDARSYPLRRMYVRGALRQLGHPALLAASYSGNVSAVATAVVHELEEGLVSACGLERGEGWRGAVATAVVHELEEGLVSPPRPGKGKKVRWKVLAGAGTSCAGGVDGGEGNGGSSACHTCHFPSLLPTHPTPPFRVSQPLLAFG